MIRIGLIGCGGMGQSHRAAFEKLQGRALFTAAVDPDLPRAQATADLMGCDTVAADYRQILDHVSTPPSSPCPTTSTIPSASTCCAAANIC